MAVASIQDRTAEFKSVLAQTQRRQNSTKVGSQRRSLLTDAQKAASDGDAKSRRSEFARKAADIGRGISATMGKLEKLAQRESIAGPVFASSQSIALMTLYSCKTTYPVR